MSIGRNVSVNHHATLDGGRAGIVIGDHCRLAAYSHLYAFNHGLQASRLISEQPVTSVGIRLEQDVWLGSHAGVTDGVTMAKGAVAGMNSVVTRDVAAYTIVAGNPARPLAGETGRRIRICRLYIFTQLTLALRVNLCEPIRKITPSGSILSRVTPSAT